MPRVGACPRWKGLSLWRGLSPAEVPVPATPPIHPWSFAEQNSRSGAMPRVGACPHRRGLSPVRRCLSPPRGLSPLEGPVPRGGGCPRNVPIHPVEFCRAKLQKRGYAPRRGLSPLEGLSPAENAVPATPPFTPWSFAAQNSRSGAMPRVGACPCWTRRTGKGGGIPLRGEQACRPEEIDLPYKTLYENMRYLFRLRGAEKTRFCRVLRRLDGRRGGFWQDAASGGIKGSYGLWA
jgi:hypothetical protein